MMACGLFAAKPLASLVVFYVQWNRTWYQDKIFFAYKKTKTIQSYCASGNQISWGDDSKSPLLRGKPQNKSIQDAFECNMGIPSLTPCGLEPYDDLDQGQHWLGLWLVAWLHQAIIWTAID